MLPAHTQFIRNASTVKSQPPRVIMDGIIQGSLNAFQKSAVDGLIHSALPTGMHEPEGHKALVHKGKGKAPATKKEDGFMPYPGAGGKKVKGHGVNPSSAGLDGSKKSY
jgi:hypothetical protein